MNLRADNVEQFDTKVYYLDISYGYEFRIFDAGRIFTADVIEVALIMLDESGVRASYKPSPLISILLIRNVLNILLLWFIMWRTEQCGFMTDYEPVIRRNNSAIFKVILKHLLVGKSQINYNYF